MTDLEQHYREAEDEAAARRRAKARRQPLILITLLNVLILAVGVTASVDLRRLQTPGGTALRWVAAAVFGDCEDYVAFSLPDSSVPDPRSPHELCADLQAATVKARNDRLQIGLRVMGVVQSATSARVRMVLTEHGKDTDLVVQLVKRHGAWRVVRDATTCGSVGCT